MRALVLTFVAAASLLVAGQAAAATFYVGPTGSDAAAGTSPASAWKTVAKVNETHLAPGDTVLFQGGATFSGLLEPKGSGAANSPITFGSFGSGRANISGGIQLESQSWLAFDRLKVDTGSWRTAKRVRGIRTSDSGTGVQNVTVTGSQFVNVAIGLLFSNHRDQNWTLTNNLVSRTGDSGILIFDPSARGEIGGHDLTFTGNQILDTGLDRSLGYKRHGVYDIGTNIVWRNNVIRRFSEGGFSLRARSNTLIGNVISDGPYAIYYSPYDSTPGKTTLAYNRISRVTGDAIELASSGNVANVESFVIANNSIDSRGSAPGIRVVGTRGSMTVVNNLVETQSGPLFRIDKIGKGLVEKNNLWWSTTGSPSWGYLGRAFSSLGSYVAGSGHGAGDRSDNPRVAATFQPPASSPVAQAGTTSVAGAPPYVGDCAPTPFHFCGSAPSIGSLEPLRP